MSNSQSLHIDRQGFDRSWWKLLDSGEKIIKLCETRSWFQASRLLATRETLSQQHFQRYPIGPTTRNYYQDRLCELFDLEETISSLKLHYASQLSTRPNLTLV